ncbi:MAG: hypothetical protein LW636_04765 [Planctomycetaceae bacterium]|nr:hypothetical protein [Planctomycetaceae bacterium]
MCLLLRLGLLAAFSTPAFAQDSSTSPRLDPRIDASRVTTLPTPRAGEADAKRATPPEAVLRIARSAGEVPVDAETFDAATAAVRRGLAFLARTQTPRGTWFESVEVTPTDMEPRKRAASVAVTALALKAFAQADALGDADAREKARRALDATLADAKALEVVTNGGMGNYVMSAVASGLSAVGDADAKAGAAHAIQWLREGQWDDAEGIDASKDWYGGAGYGNGKRPDLSNTQMMLDAMHDAGVSPEDPAMQRALAFVERTQNRKSSNPAKWAQDGAGDGGFVYSPANGGESFASDAAGEGRYGEKLAVRSLRSYGSMTYAGFKSMLYAGLSQDDPRVKDALGWISRHFTFDENPGLGQQGRFYYLHAMSRALHASRLDRVTDATGATRDWRKELVAALVAMQREDGSWKNAAERWEESNEQLATVYAVLALEEALKPQSTTTE